MAAAVAAMAYGADLTWTGAQSAVWDLETANWQNSSGTACTWTDGSLAIFPDSATVHDITIGADVSVSSFKFGAGDWSFGGANTITLTSSFLQTSSDNDTSLTLKDGVSVYIKSSCAMNLKRLDIVNATLTAASRFHNNWDANGQDKGIINIREGGTLDVNEYLVLSPGTSAADCDNYAVNIYTNGMLCVANGLHNVFTSRYGTIYSDGGSIQGTNFMNGASTTTKFRLGPGGVHFTGKSTQRLYTPIEGEGAVYVDKTGVTYCRPSPKSTYTGGTHFTKGDIFVINHDESLGAVPAETADNVFVDASMYFLAEGGMPVTAPTRRFVVNANATFYIGANGTTAALTFRGPITGTNHYAAANGTLSTDTGWAGAALALEPAAGVTNRIGRIIVKRRDLIIGGEGVTEVNAYCTAVENDAAGLVVRDATLYVTNGYLIVTNNNYFSNRGRVEVSGGVADFTHLKYNDYLNGFRLPSTTTVCRAGTLICNNFRMGEDMKNPESALLRMEKGGTLLLWNFTQSVRKDDSGVVTNLTTSAQIDWNGGVISPRGSDFRSNFLGSSSQTGSLAAWHDRIRVYVREGGAVISNNCEMRIRQPLLCGVEDGETDGGFTKWGTGMMAFVGSNLNTFNGPVNVEQGTLTMGSYSNFPATVKLYVRNGAVFNGNTMLQTLSTLGGTGRVTNPSTLTLTDALAPGYGTNTIGTLTLAGALGEVKDGAELQIDLDAEGNSDCLSYAGALDLSKLNLVVNDVEKLNNDCKYLIASANSCSGSFAGTNLPEGWTIKTVSSDGATTLTLLFKKGTTLIVR